MELEITGSKERENESHERKVPPGKVSNIMHFTRSVLACTGFYRVDWASVTNQLYELT